MKTYIHKVHGQTVVARQWNHIGDNGSEVTGGKTSYSGTVETVIGQMEISPGDWIVTEAGGVYLLTNEDFREQYEPKFAIGDRLRIKGPEPVQFPDALNPEALPNEFVVTSVRPGSVGITQVGSPEGTSETVHSCAEAAQLFEDMPETLSRGLADPE